MRRLMLTLLALLLTVMTPVMAQADISAIDYILSAPLITFQQT